MAKSRSIDQRILIENMFRAFRSLIDDHGWKEIMYAPRDGTPFEVISVGSVGIHPGRWLGNESHLLFVEDGGDLWPANSSAVLFRRTAASDSVGTEDKS